MTNSGNLDRIRHDQGWLAEGGFSVTNLGNLDKIRHDQGWLAEGDFPSQIWEIWTGSDMIRAGWLRGIFRHEFRKINGQDQHDQGWLVGHEFGKSAPAGRSHVAEGHPWGPKAIQLAKRACPPRRGLEGEPRSGSNF